MGKWVHRLTLVDREKRTAVCNACGPVPLKLKGAGSPRCGVASKKEKRYAKPVAKRLPVGQACEICGDPAMCWDHDHRTGLFRGWLCHGCNVAIGFMRDNVSRLRRAVEYLETRKPADS